MAVSGFAPGGNVRDHRLFVIGTHEVLHDKYQIVIRHPKTCSGKGASQDQHKTLHPYPLAVEKLVRCGVRLSPEQQGTLREVGGYVAETWRRTRG